MGTHQYNPVVQYDTENYCKQRESGSNDSTQLFASAPGDDSTAIAGILGKVPKWLLASICFLGVTLVSVILILIYPKGVLKNLKGHQDSTSIGNIDGSYVFKESKRAEVQHHNTYVPVELVKDFNFSNEKLNILAIDNLQNRASFHLGKPTQGYVHINTQAQRVSERRRNMENLDKIRLKHCGEMTKDYIKARRNGLLGHSSSTWHGKTPEAGTLSYHYFKNSVDYANDNWTRYSTFRSYCSAPHPTLSDTIVSIERQGPFLSHGNLDWNRVETYDDVVGIKEQINKRIIYVTGRFLAVVAANGGIIGYPPLHIHHAHVHPYPTSEMKQKITLDNDFVHHHVLIQAHGDAECNIDDGGTDCLLHQLPERQGYRVVKSSGFNANYEINDVRHGSELKPLEYYVDIAIIWTYRKRVATTFLQMGNPVLGRGWMTYLFPLDPHSNFIYYRYNNRLGPGKMENFIMHTHMSFVDSVYVFKDKLGRVYNSLENYRMTTLENATTMPYIFECHGKSLEEGKRGIIGVALNAGAELLCEATKPSMQLYCDGDDFNSTCIYRDKQFDLNCRPEARLESDESIIVVAFNRIRNTSTVSLTRESPLNSLAYTSTFGEGYVGHQHTFFRADFVSDLALKGALKPSTGDAKTDARIGAYAPPSVFKYGTWPKDQYQSNGFDVNKMKRRMLDNCATHLSYGGVNFPWEKHVGK